MQKALNQNNGEYVGTVLPGLLVCFEATIREQDERIADLKKQISEAGAPRASE